MRSVNLEIDLPKGEYVVHVRLDRHFYSQVSFPDFCPGVTDGVSRILGKDDKEAASKDWDKRKLARVLTERAKSQSIAASMSSNFSSPFHPFLIPLMHRFQSQVSLRDVFLSQHLCSL